MMHNIYSLDALLTSTLVQAQRKQIVLAQFYLRTTDTELILSEGPGTPCCI